MLLDGGNHDGDGYRSRWHQCTASERGFKEHTSDRSNNMDFDKNIEPVIGWLPIQEVPKDALGRVSKSARSQCDHCMYIYDLQSDLDCHMRTAHPQLMMQCTICLLLLPSLNDLHKHWLLEHNQPIINESQIRNKPKIGNESKIGSEASGSLDSGFQEGSPRSGPDNGAQSRESNSLTTVATGVICLDSDNDDEIEIISDERVSTRTVSVTSTVQDSSSNCVTPSKMEFVCNVCSASFPYKFKLNDHKFAVHCNLRFHCTKCGKTFIQLEIAHLHAHLCAQHVNQRGDVYRKRAALNSRETVDVDPVTVLDQSRDYLMRVLGVAMSGGCSMEWYLVMEVDLVRLDGETLWTMQPQFYSDHQKARTVSCLADTVRLAVKAVSETYELQHLVTHGWRVEKVNTVIPLIVRLWKK